MTTEVPEFTLDENGRPVPPAPTFESATHKVQYDLDGFGPYRWAAFERLAPGHPWKCIGESETEAGARELLGLSPSQYMKTAVERTDEPQETPTEESPSGVPDVQEP